MRLTTAFLAQDASASPNGSFNVVCGGIDSASIDSPGSVPLFAILRLEAMPDEQGRSHALSVRVTDPDGAARVAGEATVMTPKSPHGDNIPINRSVVVNMAIPAKAYGCYSIGIFVDGSEIGNIPFHITSAPQTSAAT